MTSTVTNTDVKPALLQRSSLQNNVIALYCLQAANYIIPLVTLPYLIRMLGVESYGIMALAQAVVFFLVFFVDAGFNTRAVRLLASPEVDHERANLIYLSTQWVKLLFCAISLIVLVIITQLPSVKPHASVYFASYLMVLGSLLFPTWVFQGLEVMRFTMVCSVSGRLLATAGIFLLVRSPDDLLVATVLQSSATALSGLLAISVLRKLNFTWRMPAPVLLREVRQAFSDVRALGPSEFITTAMSNSGVFLISLFANEAATGIYAAVEKLARAAHSAFQPLLKALFPRIASHWYNDEKTASTTYPKMWSIRIIAVTVVSAAGLFALAPLVLNLLFGDGWAEQAPLLRVFCGWLIAAITADTLGQFWVLARGDNPYYSKILIITSIVQFLGCLLGAWWYSAFGLAAALIVSETLKCALFARYAKRSAGGVTS